MLSVILPTYNEKENLPIVIERISQVLKESNIFFEIVVVDDNSPDETWKIAKELSKSLSYLRLIRRFSKKDLSLSVMDGFRFAQGDLMIVMDADLQHDENVLPLFYEIFKKEYADIVIGTRHNLGGSLGQWTLSRKIISSIGTFFARLFIRNNISDPMSGFFGISKSYFSEVECKINPRGFKILFEFLACTTSKQKIFEIGYVFRQREKGVSKMNIKIILQSLTSFYLLSPLGSLISFRIASYAFILMLFFIFFLFFD